MGATCRPRRTRSHFVTPDDRYRHFSSRDNSPLCRAGRTEPLIREGTTPVTLYDTDALLSLRIDRSGYRLIAVHISNSSRQDAKGRRGTRLFVARTSFVGVLARGRPGLLVGESWTEGYPLV